MSTQSVIVTEKQPKSLNDEIKSRFEEYKKLNTKRF